MTESEIIRMIKDVVRAELAPILMANIVENKNVNRSSVKRSANEGPLPNLRNIQPYGVASRAPKGTQALIIPIDANATHLNMVGHFDEGRPTCNDGEVVLYDAYGHLVYLSSTKMQFGSKSSNENMVLGKVFKKWAHDTLLQLQAETHIGNLGYPTSTPVNSPQYAALQASPIDDSLVLSDKAFTEK